MGSSGRLPLASEHANEQGAILREQHDGPRTRCKCERGLPFELSLLLGLAPGTMFRLGISIEKGN